MTSKKDLSEQDIRTKFITPAIEKAIVSKVNQLMSWCDELENKIEKRDAYQEKMMQAVVKQAM